MYALQTLLDFTTFFLLLGNGRFRLTAYDATAINKRRFAWCVAMAAAAAAKERKEKMGTRKEALFE
jgi:hypothetical protein